MYCSEDNNRDVMCLNCDALSCQSYYNLRVIEQTCLIEILNEYSVLYLFVECFIM